MHFELFVYKIYVTEIIYGGFEFHLVNLWKSRAKDLEKCRYFHFMQKIVKSIEVYFLVEFT